MIFKNIFLLSYYKNIPTQNARRFTFCQMPRTDERTAYREIFPKRFSSLNFVEKQETTSAYIHIPFCKRKCHYCDFPIVALGRIGRDSPLIPSYLATLEQEINISPKLSSSPLQTIYIGGGTPSLLDPKAIENIIGLLERKFGIASNAEISMEMDPGTFDLDRLKSFKSAGITRASVGVQIFDDALLSVCGRSHSLFDIEEALKILPSVDFKSWSLDLISGLPGLTIDSWIHSLRRAVQAAPEHVSVYDLQIEPGTPFSRWSQQGRIAVQQDDIASEMYDTARRILTDAGYEHYELSNYAKSGYQCRHNLIYWTSRPYYAYGMGAASYLRGRRFTRPAKLQKYVNWVKTQSKKNNEIMKKGADQEQESSSNGGDNAFSYEQFFFYDEEVAVETKQEKLFDAIMLRLRTTVGLPMTVVHEFGGPLLIDQVLCAILPHVSAGYVTVRKGDWDMSSSEAENSIRVLISNMDQESVRIRQIKAKGDNDTPAANKGRNTEAEQEKKSFTIRLSDPSGFLLSNSIISDIFLAVD